MIMINVELDDKLVKESVELTRKKTKKDVINYVY